MQTATGIYCVDGELVAEYGDAAVYQMNGSLFLEVGGLYNLWALESEYVDYMEQLKDKPRGKCLEIGLGLGVASRCILTYPEVDHLTTVELDNDVIEVHKQITPILDTRVSKWLPYDQDKHRIINKDGLTYLITSKEKYDFIFMDFYKHIDEDTLPLIKDMISAARSSLKEGGTIGGWLDPHTPVEYVDEFLSSF